MTYTSTAETEPKTGHIHNLLPTPRNKRAPRKDRSLLIPLQIASTTKIQDASTKAHCHPTFTPARFPMRLSEHLLAASRTKEHQVTFDFSVHLTLRLSCGPRARRLPQPVPDRKRRERRSRQLQPVVRWQHAILLSDADTPHLLHWNFDLQGLHLRRPPLQRKRNPRRDTSTTVSGNVKIHPCGI